MPSRENYPQGKRALFVYVSEDIYTKIHELALTQYDKFHGALSAVVEEALRLYLAQKAPQGGEGGSRVLPVHTHSTHAAHGGVLRVVDVFQEVLSFIKKQYRYSENEVLCELRERDLVMAIQNTRGSDPRTIKKYLKAFETNKLIRYDRGVSPNIIYKVLIYPQCEQ